MVRSDLSPYFLFLFYASGFVLIDFPNMARVAVLIILCSLTIQKSTTQISQIPKAHATRAKRQNESIEENRSQSLSMRKKIRPAHATT